MAKRKHIPAHDSLVRNVFSRRRAVAVLLRRVLHRDLLRHVDFASLRAWPTVHTDDELATRILDLCFIVDLVYRGRRYPLLLVLEHRSTPAPHMPWRAHGYVGDVWRRYIKDHPGLTRAFLHAYGNPRSLTRARLVTLAAQLDILLARNSPDPDGESTGDDDVRALWTYVIEVFEEGSPLRTLLLEGVSQPVRGVYMTIKEALLVEGRKKGVAEGRAAAVLDLLELRELPIPAPVRHRVLATRNQSLLQCWLARALTVPSAEQLFEANPA